MIKQHRGRGASPLNSGTSLKRCVKVSVGRPTRRWLRQRAVHAIISGDIVYGLRAWMTIAERLSAPDGAATGAAVRMARMAYGAAADARGR
jgi:hypothetical protein